MTTAEAYYKLILRGERVITDVPAAYRHEVTQMLLANGYEYLAV